MKIASPNLSAKEIDLLSRFPIRFEEGNFADYMWGGHELYKLKGMICDSSEPVAAESWEISGHPKYPSRIHLPGGAPFTFLELLYDINIAKQILGPKVVQKFSNDFPALIKFFDVQKHMSVQVHPSDHVANQWGETDPGKGEVFIVLETYANAESALYLGLKEDVDQKQFELALNEGKNLLEYMHKVHVQPGEVYALPSGVIHCWTGGTMAVEITEPSDLTYRLYDFGRGRPMHLEKGLAAINFEIQNGPNLEKTTKVDWQPSLIPDLEEVPNDNCLRIERIHLNATKGAIDIPTDHTFDALMAIDGLVELSSDTGDWEVRLNKGFSMLIPAGAGDYTVRNLAGESASQVLRITARVEDN
ncbi:MAG: mannose-6-phosphate isomerase [Candidatus Omnitrophota bacterium]|jgi:mannose-6-phosphate isomerase